MGHAASLSLYLAVSRRASAFAKRRLAKRVAQGVVPEIRADEFLGIASIPRPKGPLVWFHTTSDGETLSVQELVRRMGEERDELSFLITTSSPSAAEGLAKRIPPRTMRQYLPWDVVPFVEPFLNHWAPDLAIFTEGDLRPALFTATAARGIPLFMIDAQMSVQTHSYLLWVPGLVKSTVRLFNQVFAADKKTALFLKRLGVPQDKLEVTGVLEEGTAALHCNEAERDDFARSLAARPVWLSAFTDASEEALVIDAHRVASRLAHRLLLVLVPRTVSHGPEIAARLEAEGWDVALRSRGDIPEENTEIYVADTRGEMGLWFRLAPITFMGCSIASGGGRNPFEPAALGSAILHGPNVNTFRDSYARLTKANAAQQVRDAKSLASAIGSLLSPDKAALMAHNAWEVCSSGAEVTDRVLALLFDTLDERGTP